MADQHVMHLKMKLLFLFAFLIIFSGCSSPEDHESKNLEKYIQDPSWQTFDFSNSFNDWNSLCFLGPYTTQDAQDKTIGFHSELVATDDDGLITLIFLKNKTIKNHFQHPRNKGDFIKEIGKCFSKEDSSFIKVNTENTDWVYIIHVDKN